MTFRIWLCTRFHRCWYTRLGLVLVIVAMIAPLPRAHAEPSASAPLPSAADLDGLYIGLGVLGGAVHRSMQWDSGFGGELSLVRVRERALLTAVGGALGWMRLARDNHSLAWAEVQAGSNRLLGLVTGVSVGMNAEVSAVDASRWGMHATVWVFTGIVPYVRVGIVQNRGTVVDFGIKLVLPALRL